MALARRVVEAAGGRLLIALDGDTLRLAADLPEAGALAPLRDRARRA